MGQYHRDIVVITIRREYIQYSVVIGTTYCTSYIIGSYLVNTVVVNTVVVNTVVVNTVVVNTVVVNTVVVNTVVVNTVVVVEWLNIRLEEI